MRKFLLFPLLLGSASLSLAAPTAKPKPAAAPAAKPVLGQVKEGELRLDGKISAFLGTGLWQIDAISWTSPRGVRTDFDESKAKAVQLAPDAYIHGRNSAAKIDIKDIKLKSIVAVIGKNGPDGTVQVREVILLEGYGDRESVGTLTINPESSRLINQSRQARSAGQLQKALELARRAAETAAATGDLSGEALCTQDLGGLYSDLKQGRNAIEAFKREQTLGERLNNPMVQVLGLEGQGQVMAGMEQTDQAITLLERAVAISANTSNTIQMGALGTLAQVYMLANKNTEAVGALLRVFPLEEEAGKTDDATETLLSVITLQAATDPTSAKARLEEVRPRMQNIREESKRLGLTLAYANALSAMKDEAGAAQQYEAAAQLAEAKGNTEAAARIRAIITGKNAATEGTEATPEAPETPEGTEPAPQPELPGEAPEAPEVAPEAPEAAPEPGAPAPPAAG